MTTPQTTTPKDYPANYRDGSANISSVTGKPLKFRTQLSRKARLMLLKVLMCQGYTDKQLGSMLQCSDRTVWSLKQQFFDSPEYWQQIEEELYALLHDKEVDKITKLQVLVGLKKERMRMLGNRDMSRKQLEESEAEVSKVLRDYDAVLKRIEVKA